MNKAAKAEAYEGLQSTIELYRRYFWDREKGITPDVTVEYEGIRLDVYRVNAAHGGYVVDTCGEMPTRLWWWERAASDMARMDSASATVVRHKIVYERAAAEVRKAQETPHPGRDARSARFLPKPWWSEQSPAMALGS